MQTRSSQRKKVVNLLNNPRLKSPKNTDDKPILNQVSLGLTEIIEEQEPPPSRPRSRQNMAKAEVTVSNKTTTGVYLNTRSGVNV